MVLYKSFFEKLLESYYSLESYLVEIRDKWVLKLFCKLITWHYLPLHTHKEGTSPNCNENEENNKKKDLTKYYILFDINILNIRVTQPFPSQL